MIIRNRVIPFGGYAAINLCGLIFVKRGVLIDKVLLNHEKIHTAQQRECLFLPFFLLYIMEYLYWYAIRRKSSFQAYRNISFEREAYRHDSDLKYLSGRKIYNMWRENNK